MCPGSSRPHKCVCIPVDVFCAHMDFLRRHRQVVSLEAVVNGRLPLGPPAVAITFDDGYRNVLTNAVPVLQDHGFVATAFVPSRWVGELNAWDAHKDCFPLPIMDDVELREAERRGISVESHGHEHIDLEQEDICVAAQDLRLSMLRLTAILGHAPRYLAYPLWGSVRSDAYDGCGGGL